MMIVMDVSKVALLAMLLWVPACDPQDGDDGPVSYCETCNLDGQMPGLTAMGATDCGSVGIGEDTTAATRCIEQALMEGTPFSARQQLQGIDSSVEVGFLVDDDGVVQQLIYDSNVCGGSMCDDDCGPRVSMVECGNARVGAMPEQAIVDCDLGAYVALCEPPI